VTGDTNFAFVDAHVHFWDRQTLPYPWLAEVPSIAGRHTPEELHRETASHPPAQLLFVECGAPWLDEVNWIERLAAREPRLSGIVAHAMMNAGPATTSAIAELRRHLLVRGVRHNIQDEKDPGFCLTPEFVSGVRQLGAASLSFDLCCRHHQLPEVTELVRRCPGTRFILDHCGKPAIKAGLLDPWREHIRALATLPNVDCKLSGLITEADLATWTIEQLRPYVDHVLATFGSARLLFGGDWPVAKLAGAYPRWLGAARALLAHLPATEQAAIFRDNAARVYRLN
jgi:L-fuconolactonase